MKKNKTKGLFASIVLGVVVTACASASSSGTVTVVDRPDIQSVNTNYIGYRAPLRPLNFIKLPVGLQLLRKENKEIPLDYTVNIMESDEFLHLLSEEESSEEQLKALHHCLEKLPEEQRTSITRFFLEEMSYADIVEQTGFTLNNVKSYIQNGKRNLKICIKKQAL